MIAQIANAIDHVPDELPLHPAAGLRHIDLDHPHRLERELQVPDRAPQQDASCDRSKTVEDIEASFGSYSRSLMAIGSFDQRPRPAEHLFGLRRGGIVVSTPGANSRPGHRPDQPVPSIRRSRGPLRNIDFQIAS